MMTNILYISKSVLSTDSAFFIVFGTPIYRTYSIQTVKAMKTANEKAYPKR